MKPNLICLCRLVWKTVKAPTHIGAMKLIQEVDQVCLTIPATAYLRLTYLNHKALSFPVQKGSLNLTYEAPHSQVSELPNPFILHSTEVLKFQEDG